ncbi:hypothetical protein PF003_g33293 [Phytophthora fragariae]|nr:hypothetical protein PF003_g33293 [Phytophthora fragariae]
MTPPPPRGKHQRRPAASSEPLQEDNRLDRIFSCVPRGTARALAAPDLEGPIFTGSWLCVLDPKCGGDPKRSADGDVCVCYMYSVYGIACYFAAAMNLLRGAAFQEAGSASQAWGECSVDVSKMGGFW